MNLSLAASVLLICLALVALVALLLFGGSLFDSLGAAVRFFFTAFGRGAVWLAGSFVTLGWYTVGAVVLVLTVAAGVAYHFWFEPAGMDLRALRPPACTELIDRKGAVLDYVCPFDGVRIWRPLDAISVNLRLLVVMLEDDKFYEHGGLDVDEIWNSLEKNLEKHKIARGGSTITQQLAKNLFLSKEKTILRKVSEIPLALRLERELDKDEILELYLNTIEWGPGIYGAEAASRLYFDHEAATLTEPEAWLLALMIPNPRQLNPWVVPRGRRSLLKRAEHLSERLFLEHHLSEEESKVAFERFRGFLTAWEGRKPEAVRIGRRFPARWENDHSFSLAEIASVRRGAAGVLKRYRQEPLRLNIDLGVQEKLEALQPVAHAHDLSEVLALMDGDAIRAMIPIEQASVMPSAHALAQAQGLTTQIFHARNIPAQALWP